MIHGLHAVLTIPWKSVLIFSMKKGNSFSELQRLKQSYNVQCPKQDLLLKLQTLATRVQVWDADN